jgi:hypothetical protein
MAVAAGRPLPSPQPAGPLTLGPTEVISPTPPTRDLGSPPPVSQTKQRVPAWGWVAGGCLLLALCGLILSSAGGLAALGLRNRTNGTATPTGLALVEQPENTPSATPTSTAEPAPLATATATENAGATATAEADLEATGNARATATTQAQRTATAETRATATAALQATATAAARLTATAAAEATADFLAAAAATPQAIMLAAKNNEPLYGPVSGSLAHDPANGFIEIVQTDVNVHDFVVQARFYNPFPASIGEWDFGFLFLWSSDGDVRLTVLSDGEWELSAYEEASDDFVTLDSGQLSNLDTSGNGSNQLALVVTGNTGYFLLNNLFIASFDLSDYDEAGDVAAGTGFYEGDEVEGEETAYEDFTIWAVGEAPLIVTDPTNTPAGSSSGSLLQAMRSAKTDMERLGGLIDGALSSGSIDCQDVVNTYDRVANAPTFNVAGSGAAVQNAYNNYRAAISTFANGARDMAQNCRDFLASGGGGSIPFQQWGLARQRINDALTILNPAIESID